MIKKLISFLENNISASIITTIFVGYLCFIPSSQVPDTTDDKTAHFLAFGTMAFLWLLYLKNYFKVFGGLLIYAIFIEIVQKNLPPDFYRGFEYADILADMLGIVLGLIIVYFFKKYGLKFFRI
ncbi:MAG: VanZ family protein [Cytophagaceae bacterium]|nr:VanZ family protein [Cytophagaceae bacterium]MBK9510482.1 VanZ family protein [Cytophagaceae bacterium]MBL0300933.1 VanZ family protein [Cytophagaceae bacterium]